MLFQISFVLEKDWGKEDVRCDDGDGETGRVKSASCVERWENGESAISRGNAIGGSQVPIAKWCLDKTGAGIAVAGGISYVCECTCECEVEEQSNRREEDLAG